MPVSSFDYVNRLKLLPLPFDAKRYGPPNPNRDLLTIFMVCDWPYGHGQLHRKYTPSPGGGDPLVAFSSFVGNKVIM
jgi:hypothetical protein